MAIIRIMNEAQSKIFPYPTNLVNDILNISKNRVFEMFNEDIFKKFTQDMQKLKEYNLELESSFNIFTSISDKYKREDLHSDIIKQILDPSTKGIGNPENIRLFIELLKNKKLDLKLEPSRKIKVEREKTHEKRRIDILISDEKEKWAIIIEDKINNAVDQENQLACYFDNVKKMGLHPEAIVYLTLTPEKKLDEKISITSHKKRKELRPLIIPISVIDKPENNSFLDGFIKRCMEITKDDNVLAKVYYGQYYELLKFLGGNSMAMEFYEPTLKEIYSDKEKFKTFKMLVDLWNNKKDIIPRLIKDILKENGFRDYPNESDYVFKEFNSDISIGFSIDRSFGFVNTPGSKKIDKTTRNELALMWDNNKKLKNIFVEDTPYTDDDYWVYKYIDINKIENFEDIVFNAHIFEELLKQTYR
jgi:hypothetical protein